ncbi:TetR family transcriptional regulator [Sphaerisporangium siamense]|uniref:AcrR family transcriptional regulator n=1 Tax=Sphaerisporangium siamense TaxID=795645 RepID=A0A7W7G9L0_9ACTN|nr:TetR/AcrR family transcriptional regulator [Sphaerisporangium siamense]MBB4700690.1 AcrR family transcriptional regulator [Sphaerisporangium siamense]GII89540.1 TetR family transcriptional regulator [Sphaerisporangium siamense]
MASGEDSALIWTRPEPGSRRPRFTRDQIASTALAIADTEGFAAVSMRRIATELGAGTMTLYHYVRTKDELIALMDDALMGKVLIPDDELPAHWYDALTAIATRTWTVLMRHSWALHSLQQAAVGPNAMRHFEQSLAALAGTDLDPPEKFALLSMVDDYVHGNVLRSAGTHPADPNPPDDETAQAALRFAETQYLSGRFPHMQALFGDNDPHEVFPTLLGHRSEQARFQDGLTTLLTGAAQKLHLPSPDH